MSARFAFASLLSCVAAVSGFGGAGLGFDPVREPQRAAEIYLAPVNSIIWHMRQPDGTFRQFEKLVFEPNRFRAPDGWRARRSGNRMTVSSGEKHGGPYDFVFEDGKLVRFVRPGATNEFSRARTRPRLPAESSPLLQCLSRRARPSATGDPDASKWRRSGRLQFPYANPNKNGVLYAMLSVMALLAFQVRRRAVRIAGLVLAIVFLALACAAQSRGALLGLTVGLAAFGAIRWRMLFRSWKAWAAVLGGVLILFVLLASFRPRMLTRGFGEGRKGWSNRVRIELWSAAPKMMVDAPGGWGFCGAGPAYVDWYQPYEKVCFTGTLMNEHLNWLVEHGWFGRVVFVFSVFFVLLAFGAFAVRTCNAVPLAVWLVFAVAAWFNPILREWGILPVPLVASLSVAAAGRKWFSRRLALTVTLLAAMLTMTSAGVLYWLGASTPDAAPSVRADGRRVLVGGDRPRTWVVDDGLALGGLLFGKDLRAMYRANGWLEPIGYVRDLDDLPSSVSRLVLAGGAGDAWLRKISMDVHAQRKLPRDVVFISPPFPPQAIPPPLLQSCRVRVIVGEFACWYSNDYDNPPRWVTVVPGAERYIPCWLGHVFQ